MNVTVLRLELTRMLRNRRIMFFSTLLPTVMLILIGGVTRDATVDGISYATYTMVGIGLFGALSAALNTGATIAVERGLGWSRQLRLTPLRPAGYAAHKVLVAMVVALLPLAMTFLVAALALDVRLSAATWAVLLAGCWLLTLPFAALGLVLGYSARPDSVQAMTGAAGMLLSAFGGLWVPVTAMPHLLQQIAHATPTYWATRVALGLVGHGTPPASAVLVMLAWTLGFALAGVRRFQADTARA